MFYLEPLLGADINTGMAYVNHPEAVFLQTEIDGLYTFEIEVSGNFFIQRSIANIGKYSSLEWRFVMVVLNVAPPDAVVPGEITARVIPIGEQVFGFYKKVERSAQFTSTLTQYLTSNDEVYLLHEFHTTSRTSIGKFDVDFFQGPSDVNTLKITSEVAVPGSGAQGYLIHEVLQRLIQGATFPAVKLQSKFFGLRSLGYAQDGPGSRNLLLMGEDVRNRAGASFFATYQGVYKSLNALFCIGQAIEFNNEQGRPGGESTVDAALPGEASVRIENIEYFYRDAEILRINLASNYRETVATDLIYNEIEVGYQKYLEEEDNTLDSVHTKQDTSPRSGATKKT